MSPAAEVVSPAAARSLNSVLPVKSQVLPVATKVPAFELVPAVRPGHVAEPVAGVWQPNEVLVSVVANWPTPHPAGRFFTCVAKLTLFWLEAIPGQQHVATSRSHSHRDRVIRKCVILPHSLLL